MKSLHSQKRRLSERRLCKAHLVKIILDEEQIEIMEVHEWKKIVKNAVREAVFKYLIEIQQGHSKYKSVKHSSFKMQSYLNDHTMSMDDIYFLFAMRTRTIRGIRSDFGNMYRTNMCPLCNQHVDTIPALMECQELMAVPRSGAQYQDIYSRGGLFFRSGHWCRPERGS